MGRAYLEELGELPTVMNSVDKTAVARLREAAIQASSSGLMVVASGGAKVVAEWACRLHRLALGSPAVALTPLEFATIQHPVRAATWLLSAGGRHRDIHQAALAAKQRGDDLVLGVIGQSDTPLQKWLADELNGQSIALGLRPGADGFLATNSVWAFSCALAQAYSPWLGESAGSELPSNTPQDVLQWAMREVKSLAEGEERTSDLVVLHDAWTAVGADDLQARLIEASLSNVWISDFRNFGHGRHFWMADRKSRTRLLAMWTPTLDEMAEQSLALLPAESSLHRIRMPYTGLTGSLASLAWSIYATPIWARALGRDPGRPGVPQFGERLYEGQFPYPTRCTSNSLSPPLRRKLKTIASTADPSASWQFGTDVVRQRLRDAFVRALVFDFDGTLIESARRYEPMETGIVEQLCRLLSEGVWVGVATGRGDSVQKSLLDAIPASLRSRIHIGYHNGALVQPLEDPVDGLDGAPASQSLQRAHAALAGEVESAGLASIRARAYQITLTPARGLALEEAWRLTKECLVRHHLNDVGVWLSSHSVDVVAAACSKLHVVEHIAQLAGCSVDDVFRIGDRGAWPGNDWEMLDSPLGLSVDQCSATPSACWNLSPAGMKGTQATLYLLSRIRRRAGGMQLLLDEEVP